MESNNLFFLILFVITVGLVYMSINQAYSTGDFISIKSDCFDSDNGKVYDVPGYVSYSSWKWIWNLVLVKKDFCENDSLLEYYCGSNGVSSFERYPCPDGCEEGMCVSSPEDTNTPFVCADSDGGINYYSKGVLSISPSYGGDVGVYSDFCKSAMSLTYYPDFSSALDSSSILNEMYCNDNSTYSFEEYSCPNGCKDGACLSSLYINGSSSVCGDGKCIWPENKMNCPKDCPCKDSDKGLDYYTYGSVASINDKGDLVVVYDYCSSGKVGGKKQLTEMYCSEYSGVAAKPVDCDYGCVSGVCVKQELPKVEYTDYDLYVGSYVLVGGHKIRVTGTLENGSAVVNVDNVEGVVRRTSGNVVNGVPLQIRANGVVSRKSYVALRVFGDFKCVEGYSKCFMDAISQCRSGRWVDVKSCGNDAGHCDTQGSNALCLTPER